MSNSRIGKNALANIIGMIGQIIIAFILSPFLVHTLGDTKYGIWVIAVAFTGYMNLLDLGLSSAVNKFVAKYSSLKDQKNINAIISTALLLFFIMGLIIVLISPMMANFIVNTISIDESLKDTVHLLIIIVSFDIAIFVISGVFKGTFGGFQNYSIINLTQIISAVYKAIMFYMFLSQGHGLVAMGLISITSNLFTVMIYFILLKKLYPLTSFEFRSISKSKGSQILHYSKYTFLAMLANQVIYYSDVFVIGYFMTAAAVTYYTIPWTLAEYTKKISMAVSKTYVPAISERDAKGDLEVVRDLYISGTKYMIIISNLLSIGMIVLGGAFIAIWMGPKYKDLGETVLIILFINQYFQGPQQISYSVLLGLSKQKHYSFMSIVVSIFNLLLSILLVQKWGIIGVALGSTIPQVLFFGLYVPWLTLKTIKTPIWLYFRSTHLIGFIPTLILFLSLRLISDFHFPGGYIELLLEAFFSAFIYLVAVYYLMLSKAEKAICFSMVVNKLKFLSRS